MAEAYGSDLPRLEATLDANNNKLKANVGIGYDATDVMAFVNMSGDLEFPEDANISQGVERLMGLHYNEAAKESNPKSESAKSRSFIRAAMAFDPQMQAHQNPFHRPGHLRPGTRAFGDNAVAQRSKLSVASS